ncbi:MAG: hypothetical protein ACE5HD_00650 [Acidobacteriota bacterium]
MGDSAYSGRRRPVAAVVPIRGDAHVHIYPVFDLGRLLRIGLEAARRYSDGPFLLMLAENRNHQYFRSLRAAAVAAAGRGSLTSTAASTGRQVRPAGIAAPVAVEIQATGESSSLRIGSDAVTSSAGLRDSTATSAGPGIEAGSSGPSRLFLIAGRQFLSREGLEVLGLALPPGDSLNHIEDGTLPAEEILRHLLKAGAAAGLPWGLGKWLGARGREVRRLASLPALANSRLFFLGDIAARSRPWPEPAPFRQRPVLAGTDILPLPGAESALGSYGFEVHGSFETSHPARSFLEALRSASKIRTVGRRQALARALRNQIELRMRRKRP